MHLLNQNEMNIVNGLGAPIEFEYTPSAKRKLAFWGSIQGGSFGFVGAAIITSAFPSICNQETEGFYMLAGGILGAIVGAFDGYNKKPTIDEAFASFRQN